MYRIRLIEPAVMTTLFAIALQQINGFVGYDKFPFATVHTANLGYCEVDGDRRMKA